MVGNFADVGKVRCEISRLRSGVVAEIVTTGTMPFRSSQFPTGFKTYKKEQFWEHVHATQPIVQNIHYTLNIHTPARGPIRSVGKSIVFLSIFVYTVLMFILLLCCFILTFTLFYRLYIRIIRDFVNRRRKGFSGSSANACKFAKLIIQPWTGWAMNSVNQSWETMFVLFKS